jgi:beta-lactamase regulating signal transducer with metallopeptidase domain
MIDFIIKSSFSLSVFFIFYKLFLENEKMHLFNRFYLLITLLFSLVIPFITIQTAKEIPIQVFQTIISEPILTSQKEKLAYQFNWNAFLTFGYVTVMVILLLRFTKNVFILFKKAKTSSSVYFKNTKIILLDEKVIPHTFLNFIFVNKHDFQSNQIQEELFAHELVHIQQKHSLDILFIEILKTVFWFNPLFYAYKKAIQLNHEFLADENIVKKYNNVPFYQALLLNTNGSKPIYLTSNLNYLVTKKRLIMMTKSTSKQIGFFKKALVLPIVLMIFMISCVQEKQLSELEVVETTWEEAIEVQEKARSNESQQPNYYDNTTVVFKDKDGIKKEVKYADLDEEQKKQIPPPPPSPPGKMKILQTQLEKYKNKTNYAVWVDGIVIENKKLNSFSPNDFVFVTESFVHKNARSKRFPQEKQVHLYSEKGFNKAFLNNEDYAPNQTIYLDGTKK